MIPYTRIFSLELYRSSSFLSLSFYPIPFYQSGTVQLHLYRCIGHKMPNIDWVVTFRISIRVKDLKGYSPFFVKVMGIGIIQKIETFWRFLSKESVKCMLDI